MTKQDSFGPRLDRSWVVSQGSGTVINRATSESGRAVPFARDPNRRTWASGMAAAIPATTVLIRGSMGMAIGAAWGAVIAAFWSLFTLA
jgi:hypothetical protein